MTSVEDRNSGTWRDENLLIVYAVEGYARRHNMTTRETLKLFGSTAQPKRSGSVTARCIPRIMTRPFILPKILSVKALSNLVLREKITWEP